MTTTNPRITITLKPAVHAVLQRLSAASGNSQSAIVADLLEQSSGVLERVVKVLEAAASAKETMRSEMADNLEAAQGKLEKQLGLVLETLDDGFRPILEHAEEVKRRAGRSGPRSGTDRPGRRLKAPMSNRGVTPRENANKAQVKKGGRRGPL